MLKKLKKLNSEIEIFSIKDKKFEKYGNVIEIETDEIVKACEKLIFPDIGSEYIASVNSLETLNMSEALRQIMFGGCDAQIGITHGHNNFMNGLEYHRSSEVNIAATPLVLILGLQYEMKGNEYDSSKVKAFYMEKGDAAEIYATTLHFCPCQVSDSGFSCVVVLPKNTNTYRFMSEYDIIGSETNYGEDLWRLFDTEEKNPDRLPTDTSMRRCYVEHLKKGGRVGNGFGVRL